MELIYDSDPEISAWFKNVLALEEKTGLYGSPAESPGAELLMRLITGAFINIGDHEVRKDVENYYTNTPGHTIHHVLRVVTNALKIAETEDCDKEVVKAAALLHDIARNSDIRDHKAPCHADKGAEMAKEILKDHDYSEEQITNILHSIRVHRYSKSLKPETIEAAILQDAIDAFELLVYGARGAF